MGAGAVLVTGGAGYIGSVVVEDLLEAGERVIVLDDLSKGHRQAVTSPAVLVEGNIGDTEQVAQLCRQHGVTSVVHMAASSLVGESVTRPGAYYRNNVFAGVALLDGMVQAGVRHLVFSSTAAVYGEPGQLPIEESAPTTPTNPYGETKLAFERALAWYGRAHGITAVALRYFNAAGATARNGEHHEPETHLIPNVLDVARGRREVVQLFGDDYPTPDGTCIRDYIHVADLARAHRLALRSLPGATGTVAYNLGCGGDGYSVKEVIEAVRAVTGRPIAVQTAPRREGDPARLVASSAAISRALGWQPARQDLRAIVEDAWRWLEAHPDGYR